MRITLTEDEKRRILGLHGSNIIMEQGNPKVTQIQNYLISKGHKLGNSGPKKDGADGLWGGKTLAAVKAEFKVDLDDQGNIKTAETPTATTTTPGTTTTTTPDEKLPTLPAGTVSTNKPPAQLAGQTTPQTAAASTVRTRG
jgi:hypothetical protein